MKNSLQIIQITSSIFLILAILMQSKGTGFGRAWGSNPSSFTRRGLEKIVFRATFVVSVIFILVSILQLIA